MSQDAVNIRALAVDDHPLLRAGIAALIADETDIALVLNLTLAMYMHVGADCGAKRCKNT
jgi:DNA-binding NarL/FixJ family response regulator